MRILFLTDNYPPEVNAPASRTYEHAVRWARAGADVTIVTSAPNFPQGKVYEGYRNKLIAREHVDGVRVIRVWSYISANAGMFRRTLDFLSFAATSFLVGLFIKTDVVVATSPQFFTAWSGAALGFFKRKPWIFELRDIWPESIAAVDAGVGSRALALLERIELWLYRNAAKIIAVTPAFRTNLAERGIDPAKIEVITGGADLAFWSPRPPDLKLRDELGLKDKFVVGYVGTFGMAHSLDFIVLSATALVPDNVHFLLVGSGGERLRVERLIAANNITNVTLLDPIPKADVPNLLASVDAALVPLRRSETFLSVIPSKIFEAASLRRPIILGVDGQAREIIEQYDAGLYFEPENTDAFVSAVRRLRGDDALYRRLQEGGSALAKAYDRDALADRMLDIIRDTPRRR